MGDNRKAPPPPPGSAERRRDDRLEILAQIDLRHGDDVRVLAATNVSVGGMFVCVDEGDEIPVAVGDVVSVYLNLGRGIDGRELELTSEAEVVRTTPLGFGLMWSSNHPSVAHSLEKIMAHIRPHPTKTGDATPR